MKKKGFTLIELLGVILILGLIAIISVPPVLKEIKKSKKELSESTKTLIIDAAKDYYEDHINEIERDEGKIYCINLSTLTAENYINGKLKTENLNDIDENLKVKLAYYNEKFNYDIVNECIDSGAYITFDYLPSATNKEQSYAIVQSGYYELEVWGAQGGNASTSGTSYQGGYGGYSVGTVRLNKGQVLYINVGGQGNHVEGERKSTTGGYNGGGNAYTENSSNYRYSGSGGGATHIAFSSGTLASFDTNEDGEGSIAETKDIIIVAGGGGGTWYVGWNSEWETRAAGHGGGFKGVTSTGVSNNSPTSSLGGTQTTGYKFGQGQSDGPNGAGGGWYGGTATGAYTAGGGSGYIGNTSLTDAVMYCYNCEESGATATKTINTKGEDPSLDSYNCPNGYNTIATSKCAKAGNGYAKITFLKEI